MPVEHFPAYEVEAMVNEAREQGAHLVAGLALQLRIALDCAEPETEGLALGNVWRSLHTTKIPPEYIRAVLIAVASGRRVFR